MTVTRGALLREGKTKKVWEVVGHPDLCIVEQKNDVTTNDDPTMTRQFGTKAVCATQTTSNVFALLQRAGLPVAFSDRLDDTSFLAPLCRMVPLECVIRRYAVGSYLKRHPTLSVEPPHRFADPYVEFFLKTTKGVCTGLDGGVLLTMPPDPLLTDGRKVEDPLIADVHAQQWQLLHSKLPTTDDRCDLNSIVPRQDVIRDLETDDLVRLVRQVFVVLEQGWEKLECSLFDLKLELGFDAHHQLRIADVITADEWRLHDKHGRELSKQTFRDGHPLAEVEETYQIVAALTKQFESL